jgi:hypothetical protein
VIGKIVLDPNHRPVDYKSPLGTQLRRTIVEVLVKFFQKPGFIDSATEMLNALRDERTVPITEPVSPAAEISESASDVDSSSYSASSSSSDSDTVSQIPMKRKMRNEGTKSKHRRKHNSQEGQVKRLKTAAAAGVTPLQEAEMLFQRVEQGLPLSPTPNTTPQHEPGPKGKKKKGSNGPKRTKTSEKGGFGGNMVPPSSSVASDENFQLLDLSSAMPESTSNQVSPSVYPGPSADLQKTGINVT